MSKHIEQSAVNIVICELLSYLITSVKAIPCNWIFQCHKLTSTFLRDNGETTLIGFGGSDRIQLFITGLKLRR